MQNLKTICLLIVVAVNSLSVMAADNKPYCLPGMDPIKDNCEILQDEPEETPIWESFSQEERCLQYQKMAEEITKGRDQGIKVDPVARMLLEKGRRDMIWVARQVYWPQTAWMDPQRLGMEVWMRCTKGDYPKP